MKEGSLALALGLSEERARVAWRAVRGVALADGTPGERSARLIEVARLALGVAATETVASGEVDLAVAFPAAAERRALVDALVVPACIEGEVSAARERAVQAIARRLEVRSPFVDLLPVLRRRRVLSVKRTLASCAPDGRLLLQRIWQEDGVVGLLRVVTFLLGMHRDPELAARFHALATFPEGSFGRAVADHFRSRGIAFPGEKDGIPEKMAHHDLLHVLNGYDTDPSGECELAAFYTGFADGEAFTFVVTVLATFHLGLPVSPAVVVPARGAFDPERAVAAFVRGRGVRVDVMGAWDYWELMPLPLEEARARIGIEPPALS